MQEIYLDNAATTKVYKEVAQLATDMMCGEYGNPSSLHEKGFGAELELKKARERVAAGMGATSEEITFTSGGTEANNLAIIGTARALARRGRKIITTKVEHSSVRGSMEHLKELGFNVVELAPLDNGCLDLEALEKEMDDDTILVSGMLVNSEVGSISSIGEGVAIVKKKNPSTVFHTDGVQAFGKIPFSVSSLGVDLLTVSGHKIHGPKGVGALYIKKGVRLLPILYGGGQEKGMRAGTENTSGIVAFGKAAEIAGRNMNENFSHVVGLCKYFVNKAEKSLGLRMNSTGVGTPYICNISVPGYRSEIMLHHLESSGIYVSSGSACAKGAKSHVLEAMGLSNQRIDSALRVSFTESNTTEEIDRFFEAVLQGRQKLIRS